MNKNFIYTVDSKILVGKIINLPENVTEKEITERIKAHDYLLTSEKPTNKEVTFTSDEVNSPDLEIDWTAEYELPKE